MAPGGGIPEVGIQGGGLGDGENSEDLGKGGADAAVTRSQKRKRDEEEVMVSPVQFDNWFFF